MKDYYFITKNGRTEASYYMTGQHLAEVEKLEYVMAGLMGEYTLNDIIDAYNSVIALRATLKE